MKIIIAGSRTITDKEAVFKILDEEFKDIDFSSLTIVSGGAAGVDTLAIEYAKERVISCGVFMAEWKKYKKAKGKNLAGLYRNLKMADYADSLIAFWDGASTGTAHMIGCMEAQKKPYKVIRMIPE